MAALVTSSSHQPPESLDDNLLDSVGKHWNYVDQGKRLGLAIKHGRAVRLAKINKIHARRTTSPRKSYTPHVRWDAVKWLSDEESLQLAADPYFVLPSDRDRARSKPRLKRQEAFHQPKTQLYHSDVVSDDSELYKLGLLYDDEHTRGPYFNLNTIVHSNPTYLVQHSKRAKKQRQDMSYLHLDLSFSSLGSDVDVEQFMAPDVHEIRAPLPDDQLATRQNRDDSVSWKRSHLDTPLSVIHELPENSRHPSELSALVAATDFPDLIPDEEEDCPSDWAFLEEAEILSTTDTDVDTNAGGEDSVDTTSAADEETWVVLGDGS